MSDSIVPVAQFTAGAHFKKHLPSLVDELPKETVDSILAWCVELTQLAKIDISGSSTMNISFGNLGNELVDCVQIFQNWLFWHYQRGCPRHTELLYAFLWTLLIESYLYIKKPINGRRKSIKVFLRQQKTECMLEKKRRCY